MSIIERNELKVMLHEVRVLRLAMIEGGNLGKASALARQIKRIKLDIARDREIYYNRIQYASLLGGY